MYYLLIGFGVVQAVEVCLVTVLVPPASFVGHGTAGDEGRWVPVTRRERALIVVLHRVACIDKQNHEFSLIIITCDVNNTEYLFITASVSMGDILCSE